jgi:hypothetical protein
MAEFRSYAGKRLPMAEVFSVAIVTSPSFVRFLDGLDIPVKKKDRKWLAIAAAHLLMGLPIPNDPNSLFLAQLMSSGLDVDKLDYMLRESHFTGITLGVSLDWLLKKLFISKLSAEQLPDGLKVRVKRFPANSSFAVLALSHGGQFAFEEFCIARLALHEKIYLHQKIRAAEAAMKYELRRLMQEAPPFVEAHRWLFLREAMIEFPDAELPTLSAQASLFDKPMSRTPARLAFKRFQVRRLPFRAFGFGWQNAIAEPLMDEPGGSSSSTDRLVRFIENEPKMFLHDIHANLGKILGLVEQRSSHSNEQSPSRESDTQILIDLPRISSIQQGHDSIHFERNSRLPLRWTMPIDRIVDYYHRNRALAYIFCPEERVPFVLLAVEKTVWDLFKVIYVQDGCVNSRELKKAAALKERLHKASFYDDARELQPVSDYLNSLDAQGAVSRIARKLAQYEPRSKRHVTPASITTYVSQFPAELQDATLAWLETLEWIAPEIHIRTALERTKDLQPIRDAKRIGFSPLGAATDSASRLAYDLRDEIGELFPDERVQSQPLREALSNRLDSYILYDDNINSGKQALNIVSSWLGKQLPPDLSLDETHVTELSNDDKRELISKPIVFVFSVETEGACEELRQRLVSLCGLKDALTFARAGKTLRKEERVFSGRNSAFRHAKRAALRDYLSEIARSIFDAEGKDERKAQETSLGYAGAEAMIVFPYNCPTMTVSALWVSGKIKGKHWYPLVERTRRRESNSRVFTGDDA